MDYSKEFDISYSVITQRNYLVISSIKTENIIEYCANMIESNDISGILKMHKQIVDGQLNFYFDITGKIKFTDIVNKTSIEQNQGQTILTTMVNTVEQLPKYFLSSEFCFLDEEYIFVDENFNIYFVLFPYKFNFKNSNICEFFRKLIVKYLVNDSSNSYYNNLLIYLSKDMFDINSFKKLVQPPVIYQNINTIKQTDIAVETSKSEMNANSKFNIKLNLKNIVPKKEAPISSIDNKSISPIAIPDIPIPVVETQNIKKPKKEKQKKEKPKKDNKKSIWTKLKEKKSKNKSEPIQIPITQIPNVPMIDNIIPSVNTPVFDGTISLEDDLDKTVILNGECNGNINTFLEYNGQIVPINNTPFTIGRKNTDYVINVSTISHIHAVIKNNENKYFIEDKNSKNSTFVNGKRIPPYTEYPLEDGAIIKLGTERIIFHISLGVNL